jgi:putative redox protein
MPPNPASVRASIGASPYATSLAARGHALSADEPADLGGTDAGPTPIELLLAALSSCTLITLRMYADRKGWPMEAARVDATHEREGVQDRIAVRLTLDGPLDATQRARLVEIAGKCPVHRMLAGTPEIRIVSE